MIAQANENPEEITADVVYSEDSRELRQEPSLTASLEVFTSTVEQEDYLMGEYQQKAAENGLLPEVIFDRNEPPLHHFHKTFRKALGLPAIDKHDDH